MLNATLSKLSNFTFELPNSRIAQFALNERTDAKLLSLSRETGEIRHQTFRDIVHFFSAGDVLVLNNTKVIPARLFGKRKTGARIEMLVMNQTQNVCKVLLKPSGRIRQGEEILLNGKSGLTALVLDDPDQETGIRHLQFQEPVEKILNAVGKIPLPPYIDREETPVDRKLYQTVFAEKPGAVASPTAGLHFNDMLLDQLREKGVEILFVTLHVSYGTFQPVQTEVISEHQMYEEFFQVSKQTARCINEAKKEGRSVTACGTTVVRTLEAATDSESLELRSGSGTTSIFIYPPYTFRIPDRLITNFHLPKSTLLMLTSAFAGHEYLMKAYREAIEGNYRFYSYGDAMFIL